MLQKVKGGQEAKTWEDGNIDNRALVLLLKERTHLTKKKEKKREHQKGYFYRKENANPLRTRRKLPVVEGGRTPTMSGLLLGKQGVHCSTVEKACHSAELAGLKKKELGIAIYLYLLE